VGGEANLEARVGATLGGTYRLDKLIAQGGMGAIYQAAHLRVPRQFAVKLLNPQIVGEREVFERFQREAEIASALGHDNIVQVFDFNYSDDGVPYMVLELLQGEDLSQRIARRGRLGLREITSIVEQTCSALEAAHSQGIVHRDLKPQNIFLCKHGHRDDVVKVLDFGISKILHAPGAKTQTGAIFGTPHYMAPEQAEGRQSEIDHRTDIFSFGAILYECLTGQLAFDAPSMIGAIYKVCHVDPEPITKYSPDTPPAVEQVVRRALAKHRDQRYQNVTELGVDFLRACNMPVGALLPEGAPAAPAEGYTSGVVAVPSMPTPLPGQPVAQPMMTPLPGQPLATPVPGMTGGMQVVPGAPPGSTPVPGGGYAAPGTWPPAGAAPGTWPPPGTPGEAPPPKSRVGLVLGLGVAGLVVVVGVIAVFALRGGMGRTPADVPPPPVVTAPAVPPPATQPAPRPATPAAPSVPMVKLTLKVTPANALVELNGVAVSEKALKLPRGTVVHKLVVSAPGYVTETREITPMTDGDIVVSLEKHRVHHPKGTKPSGTKTKRGPVEEDL
jgi:tRNA A-37 threonylcarbamoyl transferase component Bud32